jgi:hypothetical protein
MGDQCANIAKLVPLAGEPAPNKRTEILDAIERMGALARRQITETKAAFRTRNVALVGDLVGQGAGIAPINREIFNRAVEIGDHVDAREWAMFMILAARAVERIADNAVEIAEQTAFVVTGLFREFTYASSPPARSDRTDSSRLGMFGSPQGRADPTSRSEHALQTASPTSPSSRPSIPTAGRAAFSLWRSGRSPGVLSENGEGGARDG